MAIKPRLSITALLLLGYAVLLAAVLGLGWFATGKMRQLQTITEDLYSHPFAVSNAATELKASLFDLRLHILEEVFLRRGDGNRAELARHIAEQSKLARRNLAIIKANFLGDMAQVSRLEADLDRWDGVRGEIFAAAHAGDYDRARDLALGIGTQTFDELTEPVEYILSFARNKGRDYARQASERSDEIVSRTGTLIAVMVFIILTTAVAVFLRVRYLQRELQRQATLDFLTGIPNRRHFMVQAERELHLGRRHASPFSLVVSDLDHFKSINDRHGHPAGDQVLKHFCAVGRQALRKSDILGRIGGEEFAILLPNTGLTEALVVAERVRKAVAETGLDLGNGTTLHITGSFGLTAHGDGDRDLDDLLRRADAALYEAKESGRNRVCTQKA
ncbi:MAG: diguanylate cyclase [Thiobacillus sp.]|nr:diguanylate cyclase [Thiobacillus sp.]